MYVYSIIIHQSCIYVEYAPNNISNQSCKLVSTLQSNLSSPLHMHVHSMCTCMCNGEEHTLNHGHTYLHFVRMLDVQSFICHALSDAQISSPILVTSNRITSKLLLLLGVCLSCVSRSLSHQQKRRNLITKHRTNICL